MARIDMKAISFGFTVASSFAIRAGKVITMDGRHIMRKFS